MFVGFDLSLLKQERVADFYEIGKKIYEDKKAEVSKNIEQYISEDGNLRADEIENDWFPLTKADVFLSHSHKDEKLAVSFAGFLHEEYNVNVFIDSCIWKYSNDLLKEIDNEYCVTERHANGDCTYSYNIRNQSTAHVHMMLNAALMKMIDETECLMFLNTPNSIKISDIQYKSTTASPWIYSELLISQFMRRKGLMEYRIEKSRMLFENAQLPRFDYPATTSHLVELLYEDIILAGNKCEIKSARTLLNQLYIDKGLINKNY